ncbi:MAG TPA: hypothetical protein VIK89_03855 [Cytophagaceae bacterium]
MKKTFGAILTILGIIALIYSAYTFVTSEEPEWRNLIVTSILGIIFFSSGISLIKSVE